MADLTIDSNLGGSVGTVLGGSVGPVGPVTLAGIPDAYTFNIDRLPKIRVGLDRVEGKLDATLSITEVPSVRTHLPANYTLALSVFGVEVAAVRLCGEGQVITEPYEPNPCEICGRPKAAAMDLSSVREAE